MVELVLTLNIHMYIHMLYSYNGDMLSFLNKSTFICVNLMMRSIKSLLNIGISYKKNRRVRVLHTHSRHCAISRCSKQ